MINYILGILCVCLVTFAAYGNYVINYPDGTKADVLTMPNGNTEIVGPNGTTEIFQMGNPYGNGY